MEQCLDLLSDLQLKVATAESCTAGGIAFALTQRAGSSAWFDQGWVTYTLESKHKQLGVAHAALKLGVVSSDVAAQMAFGALERSAAQLAVSVTGVAGPGGGTTEHPVGCCWFGFACHSDLLQINTATVLKLQQFSMGGYPFKLLELTERGNGFVVRCDFTGNRSAVRRAAVCFALEVLAAILVQIKVQVNERPI